MKMYKIITNCILFNFTKIVIVFYVMAQDIIFDISYSTEVLLLLCLVQIFLHPIASKVARAITLLFEFTEIIHDTQNILMMVDSAEPQKINKMPSTDHCLHMNGITLTKLGNNILTNASLTIGKGKCFAFCKSDKLYQKYLLRLLLGEVEPEAGEVQIYGRLSFCPEEPWLFPLATVRENIICGSHFNYQKFQRVIAQCCLNRDLLFLPLQDMTVIGSRSAVNITLEQAAKITIARALYRDAELYIFDNIFANLTSHTSDVVVRNITQTKLKDTKSIIFFLRRKCELEKVDQVYRVVCTKIKIIESIEAISEHSIPGVIEQQPEEDVSEDGFDECLYPRYIARPFVSRRPHEIQEGPKCITKIFKDCDEFIGIDISLWEIFFKKKFFMWSNVVAYVFFITFILGGIGMELLCLSWDYVAVIESITGVSWVDGFLPFMLVFALASTLVFLIFAAVLSHAITEILVKKLQMLLVNLPFWRRDERDAIYGCLKDRIGLFDLSMFDILFNFMQSLLSIAGYTTFTALSVHFAVIPLSILISIILLFIKICSEFHTKLIELQIHSWNIVEGYFQFNNNQILSIRGLKASEIYRENFATHMDKHTSIKFLTLCLTEASCLWLTLLSVLYLSIACIIIGLFPDTITKVGLTLYSGLMIHQLIPTFLTSSFDSSELLLSLKVCGKNLNSENHEYCKIIPEEVQKSWRFWPSSGIMETKYLIVNYEGRLTYMHFSVKPRELIGVVGSGNTAVLSAAYNLCETLSGQIIIDGKEKPLYKGLIPARPFLFSGRLRDNLDPLKEQADDIIWYSLDKVGMAHEVSKLVYGLVTKSKYWDRTFTVYQMQLLLLAAALATERKLVFLHLDSKILTLTEELDLVGKARKYLPQSTLFILSNRLRTILKCGRVIAYRHGALMEFDVPARLINQENGCLRNYLSSIENEALRTELFSLINSES